MSARHGKKVTSNDVAKLAGVSQSAVSRVFTPGGSASEEVIAKVKEAAEALGYRPNAAARALNTGRSRIVGLVVAYLYNEFYAEAVERLSLAFQERGYHVLLFMASPTTGDVNSVIKDILDYQVDGVVFASVNLSTGLWADLERHSIPTVLFNREQPGLDYATVVTDNIAGGREVARYLISLDHDRIGYVAGFEGASTQRDRELGFVEGLSEAGLEIATRAVGGFIQSQAEDVARRMFDRPDAPTAVFVCTDHMALAVMNVIRYELHLRIPEDVSVVGFDDIPAASAPCYDLTTYRQRLNRMVAETVSAMVAQIESGKMTNDRLVVPGSLIVRGSTAGR